MNLPSRFRLAAFAILITGLACALLIDHAARQAQSAPVDPAILAAAPLDAADSKRAGYQEGQLTGAVGVLAANGAGNLFHGRSLAILIAVSSFVAAGALLLIADKVSP